MYIQKKIIILIKIALFKPWQRIRSSQQLWRSNRIRYRTRKST